MSKISDREYSMYKSLIEEANRSADKDALRKYVRDLMVNFDQNRDTEYLIKLANDRYTL